MEKKLCRSNTDRVFAGVAGGLGEYFEIDAVLIRILFVILTIFSGAGIILYIIALILMPECTAEGAKMAKGKKTESEITDKVNEAAAKVKVEMDRAPQGRGRLLGGLILILLGLMFLGQIFWPAIDGRVFLGVLLLMIGLFVLTGRR
jgi:phage shock protein PspC (stress-responsive transcriptional regulator)